MRLILVFTSTIILSILYCLWKPDQFWTGYKAVKTSYDQGVDSVMYVKKININGLKRLKEADVRKYLPLEKSNLWWQTNAEEIPSALKKNPMIESATVTSCASGGKWSCFDVNVVERKPAYVALIGDKVWLIGKDGGLISPLDGESLSSNTINSMSAEIKQAVLIKGLVDENNTPEMIESRIGLLSRAITILESNIKFKVEKLQIQPNAEIELAFRGVDFKVVLDFDKGDLARIEDQSHRLARLLAEYRGKYESLERIDLAFSKIAVVKLKEVPEAATEKISGGKVPASKH